MATIQGNVCRQRAQTTELLISGLEIQSRRPVAERGVPHES